MLCKQGVVGSSPIISTTNTQGQLHDQRAVGAGQGGPGKLQPVGGELVVAAGRTALGSMSSQREVSLPTVGPSICARGAPGSQNST